MLATCPASLPKWLNETKFTNKYVTVARNGLQVIVVTIQGKEINKRENKNKGKQKTLTNVARDLGQRKAA